MELKIPIEVDFDDMKALIDDLGQLQKYKLFEGDKMVLVDVDDVADVLVKHIKAKEAQPKTGKWIKPTGMMPPEYMGVYRCSECGEIAMRDWKRHYQTLTNYCPNCGAKMKLRGEEHEIN